MAHIYYMTQRPAGPGAQPREGLVNVEALNRSDVIPSIRKGAYARLTYDRELTAQEIIGFELTPEVYKMRYIIAYQAGPHMETFAAE
ncbi:MAG: hypothetical protein J6X19_07365, partial [Clostridia bacterium]|nr:hypothetical protein [Clostridia bacterium]